MMSSMQLLYELSLFSMLSVEGSYITKNMVAYVCSRIFDFKPQDNAEGSVVRADLYDLSIVARYLSDFRMETNLSESASLDACMNTAKTLIDNGLLYLIARLICFINATSCSSLVVSS